MNNTQPQPIEQDYKERWCGYGGHFTLNLSKEGFISHLHECEQKLCQNYKNRKTPKR